MYMCVDTCISTPGSGHSPTWNSSGFEEHPHRPPWPTKSAGDPPPVDDVDDRSLF